MLMISYLQLKNWVWCIKWKNISLTTLKWWIWETFYVIGNEIYRDRSLRLLGFSHKAYVNKFLERFNMASCSSGFVTIQKGKKLSLQQMPKEWHRVKTSYTIRETSILMHVWKRDPNRETTFINSSQIFWKERLWFLPHLTQMVWKSWLSRSCMVLYVSALSFVW